MLYLLYMINFWLLEHMVKFHHWAEDRLRWEDR